MRNVLVDSPEKRTYRTSGPHITCTAGADNGVLESIVLSWVSRSLGLCSYHIEIKEKVYHIQDKGKGSVVLSAPNRKGDMTIY